MHVINVQLGKRSYPIHVESGLIREIPRILSNNNLDQQWIIISQPVLMDLYGNSLLSDLIKDGFNCKSITLADGEEAKNLSEFQNIIEKMIELKCDRKTSLIALGGGVVGDVSGFVAASFLRGIDYYQIPTTLLAMVDSAIGGKTGINTPSGKNLVGSVYQPKAVFIDSDLLKSLPKEEVNSGLAEVIKYGAIQNIDFFNKVSVWLDNISAFPYDNAIAECCSIKGSIVEKDEYEGGLRRLLNFGHTIGHALEAQLGYGKIRHGEAISYGMRCAALISQRMGFLNEEERLLLCSTIKKLSLPSLPKIDQNTLMNFLKVDKKWEKGRLHFVLLNRLGNAFVSTEIKEDTIYESLVELT